MVRTLKRNVSVQVAALDYLQNVRNILRKPTIIEADQYEEFVYRAVVDETTQAFEKDLLDTDLEAEIEKSRRFNTLFSILFIDLDDLKTINDTYGHETGTETIRLVSKCVHENLRKYDAMYRYGGDEFVVLLPQCETGEARIIASRIQSRVNAVPLEGIPKRISVSIGVATFDNIVITSRKSLINAADAALYEAKRKGRNSVCVYGENIDEIKNDTLPALSQTNERKLFTGLPVVQGIGIGRIFNYHDILSREIEVRDIRKGEINSEMERILRAIDKVKNDLVAFRGHLEKEGINVSALKVTPGFTSQLAFIAITEGVGLHHASIFDVHATILDDTDLLEKIEHELKTEMINGEHAVRNVFKQLERQFNGSTSSVLRDPSGGLRLK